MWPPKRVLLVSAQDTFVTLHCTSQMEKWVMSKGNVEKTTGLWTSNVSLAAYLGKWIIRFHCPLGTWVTHVLEELLCWCLQSASSCNYILHLLRMSRLDCESWGGKMTAAFCSPQASGNFLVGFSSQCTQEWAVRSLNSVSMKNEDEKERGGFLLNVKQQWQKLKGMLPETSGEVFKWLVVIITNYTSSM